ncbi:hypothetical protein M413DRAFT_444228 [Hebeloma cylindrosporum]|uniref:Uncharacterized protein n=1 Tax=Hebeloma cylindrosporum TaxID=76867 RepID=A0A0C3C3B4_HEBCY|nr:hypothetical protein M413DRAFT_444228 [Hebeloma cylindrosporum h7]
MSSKTKTRRSTVLSNFITSVVASGLVPHHASRPMRGEVTRLIAPRQSWIPMITATPRNLGLAVKWD